MRRRAALHGLSPSRESLVDVGKLVSAGYCLRDPMRSHHRLTDVTVSRRFHVNQCCRLPGPRPPAPPSCRRTGPARPVSSPARRLLAGRVPRGSADVMTTAPRPPLLSASGDDQRPPPGDADNDFDSTPIRVIIARLLPALYCYRRNVSSSCYVAPLFS